MNPDVTMELLRSLLYKLSEAKLNIDNGDIDDACLGIDYIYEQIRKFRNIMKRENDTQSEIQWDKVESTIFTKYREKAIGKKVFSVFDYEDGCSFYVQSDDYKEIMSWDKIRIKSDKK